MIIRLKSDAYYRMDSSSSDSIIVETEMTKSDFYTSDSGQTLLYKHIEDFIAR